MQFIYELINTKDLIVKRHKRHSRESVLRIDGGNPEKHWIPCQARNDKIG